YETAALIRVLLQLASNRRARLGGEHGLICLKGASKVDVILSILALRIANKVLSCLQLALKVCDGLPSHQKSATADSERVKWWLRLAYHRNVVLQANGFHLQMQCPSRQGQLAEPEVELDGAKLPVIHRN